MMYEDKLRNLIEALITVDEWNEFCIDMEYDTESGQPVYDKFMNAGYQLKFIESQGGYEGGGEHYHLVFSVTDMLDNSETYFKVVGYYASHEGIDADYMDFAKVERKEKTIYVYE